MGYFCYSIREGVIIFSKVSLKVFVNKVKAGLVIVPVGEIQIVRTVYIL